MRDGRGSCGVDVKVIEPLNDGKFCQPLEHARSMVGGEFNRAIASLTDSLSRARHLSLEDLKII